jgi:folylpolyglutamate synthase/dihydrofolate synthase
VTRSRPLETLADLEALLARTTSWEKETPRDPARDFDLARMRALLASVGEPQRGPAVVHVAGSKGKGSVARMADAVLRAARADGASRCGLYTSPHLERLTERVAIGGREIEGRALAAAADALRPHLEATEGTDRFPTFFEILTAAAFVAFRSARATDVVLEVGLGGRLDATNVVDDPVVTAVTAIELEHARILGGTLEAIAREKAGIVKPGRPCVSGVARDTSPARLVEAIARERGARLVQVDRDVALLAAETGPGPRTRVVVEGPDGARPLEALLPLAGLHQARNAAVAIAMLRLAGAEDDAIRRGLAAARLPGALEPVLRRPDVVIDGAHTPASARAAAAAVEACFPHERLHLVLGVLEDKDVAGILEPLVARADSVVACGVDSARALPAASLADAVRARTASPVSTARDAAAGLHDALSRAREDDLVLVTGSLYLAGAARTAARAIEGFLPDRDALVSGRPPTA